MSLPRCCSLVFILISIFSWSYSFRIRSGRPLNPELFAKLSPYPGKVLRRPLMRPKLKLKQKVSSIYVFTSVSTPELVTFLFVTCIHILSFLSERTPGNIDGLADLLLSDLKNFPTVRELGESSACFIREELEKTWGSSHLSVLSEEEAQKWILGVCVCFCF